MGVIKKIDFKRQGKSRTRKYLFQLKRLFKGEDFGDEFENQLKRLDEINKDLKPKIMSLDEVYLKQINATIYRLEKAIPPDQELAKSIEVKTNRICGKIRAQKHYKSAVKDELSRVQLYTATKERLEKLYEELDGEFPATWPEIMEYIVGEIEVILDL